MSNTEKLRKEVGEAVNHFQEAAEKYGAESTQFKEAMDKTNATMEKYDAVHAEIMTAKAAAENERLDLKTQIGELEVAIARVGTNSKTQNWRETDHMKAMESYFRFGNEKSIEALLKPDHEIKTLRTDINTGAGFLVTPEHETEIIKKITEISDMRSVARVQTIGKKVIDMPTRTSLLQANYEGETAIGDTDQSAYGQEQLTTHRLTVTVPFTEDQLMDSDIDLEREISQDVSESYAQKEGNKFVLGTGVKQPAGFLTNATIVADVSTSLSSGVVSELDLINLTGQLKVGYNPTYGFNRQSLATFRGLQGSNGQFLWQMGLAPDAPGTIAGLPYVILQDMPVITANSLSVVLADFMRGYRIVDRTGLRVIRDNVTRKKEAIIELTFQKWNHGQVILPEAFKVLKTKA